MAKLKKPKTSDCSRAYPRVEKGSIVRVGTKDVDPERSETEREPIDWGEVLANSVTQATAVLTLILLIDRAGR